MNTATSHEVVIIGGGPAGLAAAAELVTQGVQDVVVIEREQQAGGVPRHCGHTGFGWREFRRVLAGPAYARRLVAAAGGVDVRTGTTALGLEAEGRIRILTPEGIRVLEATALKHGLRFQWDTFPWSCEYFLEHRRMMPADQFLPRRQDVP